MPADVDQSVLIDAFVRWGKLKGRPAIVCMYEQAICEVASGLTVTSVSFEGGSTSSMPLGTRPDKLVTILEQVLQILDGTFESSRAVTQTFGSRILQV